jgi:hypothetical protein
MTVEEIRTALREPGAHIADGYSVAKVRLRNGLAVRGFVRIRSGFGVGLMDFEGRFPLAAGRRDFHSRG